MQTDPIYLYESIAEKLAEAILRGTFAVEERMPSLRELARQYDVCIATATQVYHALEDRGLVTTRPRSGYFVRARIVEPAVSKPPDKPTLLERKDILTRVQRALLQPGLLSLGMTADPAPDLIPSKAIGRSLASVARCAANLAAIYGHPYGHLDLRVQIARRMSDAGCYLAPDDLIVTTGCQNSLSLALRVIAQPGDTIAIESPTYIGVPHLLAALGLKALEIPTHPGAGIDIDALQQALARHPVKGCLLMPSCQNPLGASMPEASKRRLVELLAQAHVPLIEDDALGDLSYERPRPKAAKAFDQEGNVLYCSSFSKTLGPGQRIGWIAPGRYRDSVAYLQSVFHSLSSPVWQQVGIAKFLAAGSYTRNVHQAALAYRKRVNTMRDWVQKYFPPGTRATQPRGGFILWVELPESVDVTVLESRAFEQGITFSPGFLFSAAYSYTHHIRLSCGGSVDWDKVEAAVAIVGKLAGEIGREGR